MYKNSFILLGFVIVITGIGCGSSAPSNANASANANLNSNAITSREIKLDPANMPPGLSAKPLEPSATLPPGISLNANVLPLGNKPIPGIPSAEALKKGFKPGKTQTPGIPDPETIRKQMGLPVTNVNAPAKPAANVSMMKSTKK